MIPPATDAQRAAMPRWMHDVAAMRIPHVVGIPVVDWLHCGHHGELHGWIITSVKPRDESGPFAGMGQYIGIEHNDSSTGGAAGVYFIADMTTDLGRDHVRRWCEEHGLPIPQASDQAGP